MSEAETPDDNNPVRAYCTPLCTNLTADLVRATAMKMRRRSVGEALVASRHTDDKDHHADAAKREGTSPSPTDAIETTTTIFRGPTRADTTREIILTNELKPKKNHSWLDITT